MNKRRNSYSKNHSKKKRIKWDNIMTLLVIILNIYIGIYALSQPDNSIPSTYNGEFDTYIVSKGDTLWEIASKYNTSNRDVREVIDAIRTDNNLEDCSLSINQEILIREVY